jgi:hypothetical protein
VNTLAFLLTGDLPWVIFSVLISHLHPAMPWLSGPFLTAVVVFPTPLILLAMGIFYLWVYVSRSSASASSAASESGEEAANALATFDSSPRLNGQLSCTIPSLCTVDDAQRGLG